MTQMCRNMSSQIATPAECGYKNTINITYRVQQDQRWNVIYILWIGERKILTIIVE
jgi:hypothetical protein